ncbi:MAG: hypothetical protein HKN21_13650 [Candidatus Eisenbacteria bacterium]|uniref:Uncharacterized protein n=1 Tax=Eiseniibacteriota bacterium TaxID=2212470 RepID=A0A7Y2E9N6_UNCEI|nr:hypothetical protein [Candidatus Eisenbacteria bacterium]
MKVTAWSRRVGYCSLLLIALLWSCRRENPSNFDPNLPPETFISGAPAESTLAFYQVQLYWNGVDPDGIIDHFEYAVTDSNLTPGELTPDFSGYFSTNRTDSLFKLTANNPQILGHRFYVRAVDNEGKVDPTPAWTYFIAHDFNFPQVVFNTADGRWIDSAGEENTVEITSTDQFVPTDTVGIGGAVEYTWTGFDADVGGEVLGFEFRPGTETEFRGGTLADTAYAESYQIDFSGRRSLFVRAIDDAGAKTLPIAVRSVVVNFSPVTWIADPLSGGAPARARVFTESSGQVYPSGTTLANGFRSVNFAYTGFDDLRDQGNSPEDPGVIGFEFRRLKNGGGPAFQSIPAWEPFPEINIFNQQATQALTSGDYLFLIRSEDELGRKGRPDTVAVNVNYPPFFTNASYFDEFGTENNLWNPGGDLVEVDINVEDGVAGPLQVNVLASDEHSADNPDPLEVTNPVVEDEVGVVIEYRVRINGSPGGFQAVPAGSPYEIFLEVTTDPAEDRKVRPGEFNFLVLEAKDDGGRITTQTVQFRVNLIE